MNKLPLLTADLIKELDSTYPNQCPAIKDSERLVWFKAGQRDVINTLLARSKLSEDDVLT